MIYWDDPSIAEVFYQWYQSTATNICWAYDAAIYALGAALWMAAPLGKGGGRTRLGQKLLLLNFARCESLQRIPKQKIPSMFFYFLIFHKVRFKRDVLWQLWDIELDNICLIAQIWDTHDIFMKYLVGSIKNSAALSCDPGEVGQVAACPWWNHSCHFMSTLD